MWHYTVIAKDDLPEIVETYPFALVCNTHNAVQPGEHWVATWTRSATTSIRTDKNRNTSSSRTIWTNIAQSGQLIIVHYRALYLPFVVNTASFSYRFAVVTFQCMRLVAYLLPI